MLLQDFLKNNVIPLGQNANVNQVFDQGLGIDLTRLNNYYYAK